MQNNDKVTATEKNIEKRSEQLKYKDIATTKREPYVLVVRQTTPGSIVPPLRKGEENNNKKKHYQSQPQYYHLLAGTK